jgi:hypothetical protein
MYFACRVLRPAALVLLAVLLLPTLSAADATRIGNSFPVAVGVGTKRTAVAYDPVNDVYLVVTGGLSFPGTISGRFVQGDGTPVGPYFKIPETAAHAQVPRVTYDADLGGFAVVWLDTRADQATFRAQVWGRMVKFAAGSPAFATGDFMIDNATGGVNPEVPPVIACAAGVNDCLVAWHQYGGGAETANDVHAVRINATTGQLASAEFFLTADNNFQGMPGIGYDPTSQMYLVAMAVYTNAAQIWVQRVQAGGGLVGGPANLATSGGIFVPDVTLTNSHLFLVTWYDGTARSFYARTVSPADGTLGGAVIPLLVGYGGNDAFGIAYNATTGTSIAVTHGLGIEDVGFQVTGNGAPQPAFDVTVATGTKNGNFNPRIAASPQRAEWLVTTSTDFVSVFGTRLGSSDRAGTDTPPPPPPPPTLIDLSPAGAPNGSWYLAEGAANTTPNGFKTYYLIQNTNPVDVTVRVYFSSENGIATTKQFIVPKQSRTTVPLIDAAGSGSFGTVFQSLTPGADIDVERSIYWGPNLEGSTGATATKALNNIWYFAEGSRGGELFNNYFMLFNPTQAAVQVVGTYFRANGEVTAHTYNIGPQQRVTVDANAIPELAGADFSATFTAATKSIVAERAMYWGWVGDAGWIGGHASMGSPILNDWWLFAEGNAAANFETFFLLLNPNPFPIVVTGDFMTEFSGRLVRNYTIPANTRQTVFLNGEFGNIGPSAASFSTGDGNVFLAERSIYWGNRVEGTNTIGSPAPAAEWHLPEGSTAGQFDTYVMLMNPNDHAVAVDATVYVEGYGQFTLPPANRPVLAAFSRQTFNMKDVLGALQQLSGAPVQFSSFSLRIAVPGGQDKIVAEHAIYWNFVDGKTYWRSGAASMGIPH